MFNKLKQYINTRNTLFKNIKNFLSGRIVFAVATLLVGILTARFLTPENRGLYTLFFTTSGLLTTVFHLGISPANVYFLNVKKVSVNILYGNNLFYIFISLILISITMLVGYIFFNFNIGFPSENLMIIYVLLGVCFIYQLTESCFQGLIFATKNYSFMANSYYVQSILLIAATLAILFFKNDLLIAIEFRVTIISLFMFFFVTRLLIILRIKKISFSKNILVDQIKFGSRNWLQNLIGFLNIKSYIFFLAFLSSPENVGYFAVSFIFVELLRYIPDSLGAFLLPEFTKIDSSKERARVALNSLKSIFLAISLVSLTLILVINHVVTFLFGIEYISAILVSRILIIAALLGVFYQVLTRYFTSEAKQIYSIISSTFGLAVGSVCSIILIPEYGAYGAALSFMSSSFASGLLILIFFKNFTRFNLSSMVSFSLKK